MRVHCQVHCQDLLISGGIGFISSLWFYFCGFHYLTMVTVINSYISWVCFRYSMVPGHLARQILRWQAILSAYVSVKNWCVFLRHHWSSLRSGKIVCVKRKPSFKYTVNLISLSEYCVCFAEVQLIFPWECPSECDYRDVELDYRKVASILL